MDSERLDVDALFSVSLEDSDARKKFLYSFEYLCKHLQSQDCFQKNCHDINHFIQKITDQLMKTVSNSDLKYEKLLFNLPWRKFMFHFDNNNHRGLKPEVLNRFLTEYVQIFPQRCERFLDSILLPLLRGNDSPSLSDQAKITEFELELFSEMKNSIKSLVNNVANFETIFVKLLKKRYPYFHNTNVHEFCCFVHNMIDCGNECLINFNNSIDVFDLIVIKSLEIDLESFFEEYALNKENTVENIFAIELETKAANIDQQEHFKKEKVLNSILDLLFDHLEDCLKKPPPPPPQQQQELNPESNIESNKNSCKRLIEVITKIFFQRILPSNSIHFQYLIFYLCSQSKSYCDVLVNDLWTLASSTQTAILLRESSFNLLKSLFLNARFISTYSIFSFLKIILQWINSYITNRPTMNNSQQDTSKENDLMYYNFCIGFCQLFCVFHSDLLRNQIECLKNMDLKRAILNSSHKPLQYLSLELRDHFVQLSSYYRIGYANISDIQPRTLKQTFANVHHEKTCYFGRIYLQSVKTRIEPLVHNLEIISERTQENIGYRIRNELMDESKTRRQQQGWNMDFVNNKNKALSSSFTTSSDDAMVSPGVGQMNSFIINHMLSDIEMTE